MIAEYGIIGGGITGMVIAWGLQNMGHKVAVFDEGAGGFCASRGNFGLIWVQGKGADALEYARWTRKSASLWPGFAAVLQGQTGVDLEHRQYGGLDIYLNEQELATAVRTMEKMRADLDGDYPFTVLDNRQLRELEPQVGPKVAGAILGEEDGDVNPLYLLRALYQSFITRNGILHNDARVSKITPLANAFDLETASGRHYKIKKLVLAAGLGVRELAPQVGLDMPVTPLRGQILVTEKVQQFLNYPGTLVRQVGEGGVLIGDSHDDVGFDDGVCVKDMARMAHQAISMFPGLETLRLLRAWGALRIIPPNGLPMYLQSTSHPNAYGITCHSGVTLAAVHGLEISQWISQNCQKPEFDIVLHGA